MMSDKSQINDELRDKMFDAIRKEEIKNVRNNVYTDKQMVDRIVKYIEGQTK